MSTELAQRDPLQELVAQVNGDSFRSQIAAALPGNVTPARFVRVTTTALRENPDLVGVDRASLFSAVVRCAQDGLLPDSREAALVKFRDKKKGEVAVYMPMIGGFRKIAAEYGWSLRTRVVYENDTFEHTLGLEETLTHNPARPGLERGPMVAAYAVATHRDGRKEIEVAYEEDIAKARKSSRASDYGPWVDWPERMWEKTVGRRLFAKLPLDESDRRVSGVLNADDMAPGEATALMYGPDTRPAEVPVSREDGTGQGAEGEATGAEHAAASPGTDGPSAPADAATDEPVEEGEFTVPASVDADADVLAADHAADKVFPKGKHKGLSLRAVADLGDEGETYIRYVLQSWADDDEFTQAAWAFCLVYLPEAHAFAKAKKEGSQ